MKEENNEKVQKMEIKENTVLVMKEESRSEPSALQVMVSGYAGCYRIEVYRIIQVNTG